MPADESRGSISWRHRDVPVGWFNFTSCTVGRPAGSVELVHISPPVLLYTFTSIFTGRTVNGWALLQRRVCSNVTSTSACLSRLLVLLWSAESAAIRCAADSDHPPTNSEISIYSHTPQRLKTCANTSSVVGFGLWWLFSPPNERLPLIWTSANPQFSLDLREVTLDFQWLSSILITTSE